MIDVDELERRAKIFAGNVINVDRETILALIAEIRTFQNRIDALKSSHAKYESDMTRYCEGVEAEIRALREEKKTHGPTCSDCKGKGWLNTADANQLDDRHDEYVALQEAVTQTIDVLDDARDTDGSWEIGDADFARIKKALAATKEPRDQEKAS